MPLGLGTMWSGDDQLLEEEQIIPSCSRVSNSSWTIVSFSRDNRRGFAKTGGRFVSML